VKRRNDLEILRDILRVARTSARKSRIVYRANLNFKIVRPYLDRLMKKGLLDQDGAVYTTTLEGQRWIRMYQELETLV